MTTEPLGTRTRITEDAHDRAINEIERLRKTDQGFILVFPSIEDAKITVITDLESGSVVSILDHLTKMVKDVHKRAQN